MFIEASKNEWTSSKNRNINYGDKGHFFLE